MTVRQIGLPTRATNSSQASSSDGPAQRQTTSFKDREEYRVGAGLEDILLINSCPKVVRVIHRIAAES